MSRVGEMVGLILSNNGVDAEHDIDVSAGRARSFNDGVELKLAAGITKRIDAVWASGSGNGGLASALTAVAIDTWYHVFLVLGSNGAVDVGFDTSPVAANLLADTGGGAGNYRRLGSVLTDGSANIHAFRQVGNYFEWNALKDGPDGSITISDTPGNQTLSVPPGFRHMASVIGNVLRSASTVAVARIYSPDGDDEDVNDGRRSAGYAAGAASENLSFSQLVLTDTSSQVRVVADAVSTTMRLTTQGWIELEL